MNDPHVVSLRYRVQTKSGVAYDNPPPVVDNTLDYDIRLSDGVLLVTMKEHHPSVGSAMERIRPYLRAWELQTALDLGCGYLTFDYMDADVIDRNPPPPGTTVALEFAMSGGLRLSAQAKCEIVKNNYPKAPSQFCASPLVENLWYRYQMYLDGRDLLTTMAYYCLSAIETDAGDRTAAAVEYNIHKEVLSKIGFLTSGVGDEKTARKSNNNSTNRPHTLAEIAWIEAAVKMLIRRVAQHAFDPIVVLPQIVMIDLPML